MFHLTANHDRLSDHGLRAELDAFAQGHSTHAWRCFGAHPAAAEDGTAGYLFRVWAPGALSVSVIGDFNQWDPDAHPMTGIEGGIWEVFVPGLSRYDNYQYSVLSSEGIRTAKADPFAFHSETRPGTASKLYDLSGYRWGDQAWLKFRATHPPYHLPLNIYECHLGSWRRTAEGTFLSYRDTATYLIPYLKEMGYTHVAFLPLTEHPDDSSWGYETTGYFSATSRFGVPEDLKYLIDQLHQAGIGVIMDWVPSHFSPAEFGLGLFDGTPTYECSVRDERPGFDFSRSQVRSFLLSCAMFWLEEYHLDGLRTVSLSSILRLDPDHPDDGWSPNAFGGYENADAIDFVRHLNTTVFAAFPEVLMIAEEASGWPGLTRPVSAGGLGFNFKWNNGWSADTCSYMALDPYFRQFHHKDITFSMMYAFAENHILPLSHDEVASPKTSLLGKLWGDDSQKQAGLRAFYTYMMTHPGKKLTFMGAEFGQWNPWRWEYSLDWHLLEYQPHRQMRDFFRAVNALYLQQPALWEQDDSWDGFQWLSADDAQSNTLAYLRLDSAGKSLLVVCSFSPVHRPDYRVGVPTAGVWAPVFSSDALAFGGQGLGDTAPVKTESVPCHKQPNSLVIDLPPMTAVIYRCIRKAPPRKIPTPRPAKSRQGRY